TITTLEVLNLTGPVTTSPASTSATLAGSLALTTSTTFTVADGSAAQDLVVSAVLSGTGGLTKQGAGTMVLSANNTYTGTTGINAGTLLVNGSQPGSLASLNGGTLGGAGTTGAVLSGSAVGSKLSPGTTGAGRLTVGGLTLNGNVTY